MNLSIIIPTYNRNNIIEECVLSLDHNDAEIIVVDDCSDTPVTSSSEKCHIIRNERRRGRAAAINTGLKAAAHELVLIFSDDIYASPDMVVRMMGEFAMYLNPKLGLAPRIVWDPDVPLTLTMKWMEDVNRFQPPLLLWKEFALLHGGYDENFSRRLEDLELQLRLKREGFELRTVEAAVGFRHNSMKIRDLVEREFMDGVSTVFLHSKFPEFMPNIHDIDTLIQNENRAAEAEAAVDEVSLLEQSGSTILPAGASELFVQVCHHYLKHGIFEGLKDIGDFKPKHANSNTLAIYNHASILESIAELDEARRLFRLVRERSDDQYWAGAEYHLGCIESKLGNPGASHFHFMECLRWNPGHNKARRILNNPTQYREIESNIFEVIEPAETPRVLFIVFGDLSNIVNGFPVVNALRERFHCETAWLTSFEYFSLVKASLADAVYALESTGLLPWDWIHSKGFTHVYFAEPEANREEWEKSGLSAIEFMAQKCGVQLETHRAFLEPGEDAILEAEEFLRQNGLTREAFVTASHGDGQTRHWPNSNLMKLARQLEVPLIVFGDRTDPEIPGAISCIDKPLQVIAALVRWSLFYLGPRSGVSWLAATTDTPMAIIGDPMADIAPGLREILRGEKDNIEEWDFYTNLQTVLAHIEPYLEHGLKPATM
jgi:glycosyltransferase involved in cell wall biosynthesis